MMLQIFSDAYMTPYIFLKCLNFWPILLLSVFLLLSTTPSWLESSSQFSRRLLFSARSCTLFSSSYIDSLFSYPGVLSSFKGKFINWNSWMTQVVNLTVFIKYRMLVLPVIFFCGKTLDFISFRRYRIG